MRPRPVTVCRRRRGSRSVRGVLVRALRGSSGPRVRPLVRSEMGGGALHQPASVVLLVLFFDNGDLTRLRAVERGVPGPVVR